MLEHFLDEKNYTCIKWFNLINEPNGGWSACDDFAKWKKGIENLHAEMVKRGLDKRVGIIGPDANAQKDYWWLDLNVLQLAKQTAMYELHEYAKKEDVESGHLERVFALKRDYAIRDGLRHRHRSADVVGTAGRREDRQRHQVAAGHVRVRHLVRVGQRGVSVDHRRHAAHDERLVVRIHALVALDLTLPTHAAPLLEERQHAEEVVLEVTAAGEAAGAAFRVAVVLQAGLNGLIDRAGERRRLALARLDRGGCRQRQRERAEHKVSRRLRHADSPCDDGRPVKILWK
jgi:hypothetical protein